MCLCAVQCMQTLDTGYLDHLVLVKLWIKVTRSAACWSDSGAGYLERGVLVRPWMQATWSAACWSDSGGKLPGARRDGRTLDTSYVDRAVMVRP